MKQTELVMDAMQRGDPDSVQSYGARWWDARLKRWRDDWDWIRPAVMVKRR